MADDRDIELFLERNNIKLSEWQTGIFKQLVSYDKPLYIIPSRYNRCTDLRMLAYLARVLFEGEDNERN